VWLLEPPVDVEHDRPDASAARNFRAQHGIASDEILVCLVGRVHRAMKLDGIRAAIDAVALLDDPRVRLVVVGDGDAMPEVRRAATRTNLLLGREAATLTGAVVDPHPAYAAADIGLAMGGSALRVLAHHVPLVVLGASGFAHVFDEQSAPMFLQDGFYGLVPAPDPGAVLAAALHRLMDPGERDRLGAFGRDLIERRFSLEAATDQLEAMFDQLQFVRTAGPISWRHTAQLLARVAVGEGWQWIRRGLRP
jgi:glycosyltransferase involved in cell wall biosynthesis